MELDEYVNLNLVHSIHTSGRKSFRGCRRRWDWVYNHKYYPIETARPLEFGVAFHKAMEVFYDPTTWQMDPALREPLRNAAIVAFEKKTSEQRADYLRLHNNEIDPEKQDEYIDNVRLGKGMLKHYCDNVSPKADEGLRPIAVEVPFEVPLRDEQGQVLWCKCRQCAAKYCTYYDIDTVHDRVIDVNDSAWKGLPVTYGGRIDCLMEDRFGRQWIFDWKTAARMSGEGAFADDSFMWNDDQISAYCWALWSIGVDIAGFIYAEIKKGFPEPPEPNKNKRMGRWFSVNKQQDTTAELYAQTVKENDYDAWAQGLYTDFITYLIEEGPRFADRVQISRSEVSLKNIGADLFNEAADMTNPNLRIYPQASRFSCNTCAFRQPCLGKTMGEDYIYSLETMFEKRTKHYYETAEPSTDTKRGV